MRLTSFVCILFTKHSKSFRFSRISQDLCSATSSAINVLLQNLDEDHNSASSDDETESQLSKRMLSVFSEGGLSFGSSYNQGMFFISQVFNKNIV